MKEKLLHFIWRFQLFDQLPLRTIDGQLVEVIQRGLWNKIDSGPDFSMAQIKIHDQIWAGSIEIHIKSSDWDLHKHSEDRAYENVILHVVYEHDKEVKFMVERNIPTLELKSFIAPIVLHQYNQLLENNRNFIPCEKSVDLLQREKLDFWLERLLVERLERKVGELENEFLANNKNWEQLLFKKLAYAFGLKINADAFVNWANSFDFEVLMRNQLNPDYVHALFFGQAGFLDFDSNDDYVIELQKDYKFLQLKYRLVGVHASIFKFFRMRPSSFPTVRIMQLATLYSHYQNLFAFLMGTQSIEKIKGIFEDIEYPEFWKNHFRLENESSVISVKSISNDLIYRIIINVIIPMKFVYAKHRDIDIVDQLLGWLTELPAEKNTIISGYSKLGLKAKNAFESQAYLELKKHFCNEKKCLNCAIGLQILKDV